MEQRPVDQFNQTSGGTRKWFGIGLLILSVLGFTTSILTANRALKDGIDTHTINALRYSMAIVLLFLFQKIRGKQLKLPKRERYTGMALGISVFMTGVGYLSATKYLPISLAVLIFYTANEPIIIIRLVAIVIAFIGIALALGIQTEATLNLQGVAFALLAAFGYTGLEIVGPVKTSMLMNTEPILTIILATIMLGERLSSVQWIGAGLVVVGIILITGRFKKENN